MAFSVRGLRVALWGAVGVVLVAAALTWRQAHLRQGPSGPGTAGVSSAPGESSAPGDTARTPSDSTPGPFEGRRAPDIVAKDVYTSKTVKLSDFKGQPVLVNFWATWCPPCKQEMPDLQTFAAETPELKVIAIGADPREDPTKLAGYAKAMGLTFTVASDEGAAAGAYRVVGIPTSFFIDRQGVIRIRHQGVLTLDEMRSSYKSVESLAENANK